jgi:hypothetical protein
MLPDPMMLRDVTSSVTEFMVRVLHSRMLPDPTPPAGLTAAFMRPIASLSGVALPL